MQDLSTSPSVRTAQLNAQNNQRQPEHADQWMSGLANVPRISSSKDEQPNAKPTTRLPTTSSRTPRRALKTNKQLSEARNKQATQRGAEQQATHISETRDGPHFVASHFFIVRLILVLMNLS